MKLVSTRDFRNSPGMVRETLADQNVALTYNGKPFAVVMGVQEDDDLAEVETAIRSVKARVAVSQMRRKAKAAGLDKMTLDEINAVIQRVRAEMRDERAAS